MNVILQVRNTQASLKPTNNLGSTLSKVCRRSISIGLHLLAVKTMNTARGVLAGLKGYVIRMFLSACG